MSMAGKSTITRMWRAAVFVSIAGRRREHLRSVEATVYEHGKQNKECGATVFET
jgi:hypothetical protein